MNRAMAGQDCRRRHCPRLDWLALAEVVVSGCWRVVVGSGSSAEMSECSSAA